MKIDERDATAGVADEARSIVEAFIERHGIVALPALIGGVVAWAVDHGAPEQVKSSLRRAVGLADELHAKRMKGLS